MKYIPTEKDTEVQILIEEDPNNTVIPGFAGFEVANFVIDPDNGAATSFCVFNIVGGNGSLKGNSCDSASSDSVYFKMDANGLDLSDTSDGTGNPLTVFNCIPVKIVDIDPGSTPTIPNKKVTNLCDIDFPEGVVIAPGQTVTITLSFELPAGWSQKVFQKNLQVLYYDEDSGSWSSKGIRKVVVNWDTMTITFETTHLTTFAASSKQSTSNSNDSGGGTQSASGGGCSITSTDHNMSVGSIVVNSLIFFLPFIVLGIKRKCDAGSLKEKK